MRNLWKPGLLGMLALGLAGCPLKTFTIGDEVATGGVAGTGGKSAGSGASASGGSPAEGGAEATGGTEPVGGAQGAGGTAPIAANPDSGVAFRLVQGSPGLELPAASGVLANDLPLGGLEVIESVPLTVLPEGWSSQVNIKPDGSLSLSLDPRFFGTYLVQYKVRRLDGAGSSSAVVTFAVAPKNVALSDVAQGIGGFVLQGNSTGDDRFGAALAPLYRKDVPPARGKTETDTSDLLVGAPGANSGDGVVYRIAANSLFPVIQTLKPLGSPTESAAYTSFNGSGGEALGTSVTGIGDWTGDGEPEVAIGAPRANGTKGAAYLVSLRSLGGGNSLAGLMATGAGKSARAVVLSAVEQQIEVGRLVRGLGDVNGDGNADLLVSAKSTADNYGSINIVYGSKELLGGVLNERAGCRTRGSTAGNRFPWTAAEVGDPTGDGVSDIWVGSLTDVVLQSGGTTACPESASSGGDGQWRWTDDLQSTENPGYSLGGAGDFDGDGAADLVYCKALPGKPRACQLITHWRGAVDSGMTVVIEPREGEAVPTEPMSVVGGGRPGRGDIDGDGYSDLLFADPQVVYGVYGRPLGDSPLTLPASADFEIRPRSGGSIESIALLGDLNGDHLADFAVSESVAADARRVYVVFGTPRPDPVK